MITRWLIFLKERYLSFLVVSIPFTFVLHTAVQFMNGNTKENLTFSYATIIGAICVSLFFLYVRIDDEFKDYEVDKKYFPERPVASGKITLKDLSILKWVVTAILFTINIIWPVAFWEFLVTIIGFFLMGKWFFVPRLLSQNRIYAVLTHNPIIVFMGFYAIALYTNQHNLPLFTATNLFCAICFVMIPSYFWEFARKTRAPEDEQAGYQTYSAIMGYRLASIFTIIFLCAHLLMYWFALEQWYMPISVFLVLVIVGLSYIILDIRFIMQPTSKNARIITPLASVYYLGSYYIIIINAALL